MRQMDPGADTHLSWSPAAAPGNGALQDGVRNGARQNGATRQNGARQHGARQNGTRPGPSMVGTLLDLLRPQGRSLRILEAAAGGDSLAAISTSDEVVSVRDLGSNGDGGRFEENAFDLAVVTDIARRPDPTERYALLARLRAASRGAVLVEVPLTADRDSPDADNPLEEAIELFREFGDSVLVLGEEHLPALLTVRELGLGGASNGASTGPSLETIARHLLAPSAAPSRSLLVSIVDPDVLGIDVSALEWCCSAPSTAGVDPAGLAVLPLSLEVRRLSDRLEAERLRGARAEAEAGDLRRKLAELARVASEDRAARESADQLVEIIAAARGYRIGLAICHARAAVRRRTTSAWRFLTTPWRAAATKLRPDPDADQ